MVREIRVYVEGGGDSKDSKAAVRAGFREFLDPLVEIARSRRIKWHVIASGGRNQVFENFGIALRTHLEAFNVLLVDSEGAVIQDPRGHLRQRDGWLLDHVDDEQCHLMVEVVEAWLIADMDSLQRFYGQGFNIGALPNNPNVEQIRKFDIERGLEAATRDTKAGRYKKIHHGPKILASLDVDRVRKAAFHCNRLFETLTLKMR